MILPLSLSWALSRPVSKKFMEMFSGKTIKPLLTLHSICLLEHCLHNGIWFQIVWEVGSLSKARCPRLVCFCCLCVTFISNYFSFTCLPFFFSVLSMNWISPNWSISTFQIFHIESIKILNDFHDVFRNRRRSRRNTVCEFVLCTAELIDIPDVFRPLPFLS